MKFEKYHCLENDFIIVEDECLNVNFLCDQHKCIGADGLILIEKNKNILFFNKDGTKAKFCGNAIRCAAMYINSKYKNEKNFIFENISYEITNNKNFYKIKFKIPTLKKKGKYYFVDSGVHHLVMFEKPNFAKATKLFKKYNINITFYYNNIATTFEKGVGLTRGCGSGLIAIMCVLYFIKNITKQIIQSNESFSTLEVIDNYIYLESEVFSIYKGEII